MFRFVPVRVRGEPETQSRAQSSKGINPTFVLKSIRCFMHSRIALKSNYNQMLGKPDVRPNFCVNVT